ncbi:hypothetical protein HYW46_06765 [Candidatus Daviesbacteria bacterium]|nr:hypothetical protein [Candidatus Daviesbacteria bacterium]
MDGPAGIKQIQELILRVINLSVGLVFFVLVIVLAIGGIKFLTSGGEQKAVQSAKSMITWGILGVVFMGLAWLILSLVEAFTGVKVTQFNLCVLFPGGVCP